MTKGHLYADGIDLNPPREVAWIAKTLADAGFEAWAVGGAVRDVLAGGTPGDWDLTTSARPGDVRRIFRRTVPIGISHGTVGVLAHSGVMYEVTTFRRDVETFGRKARVAFADRLEDDLDRRDFTMNAVAWNPLTGELRDPHGGRSDLASGILKTVGNPALRFREDRLRVLRALRFAGAFHLTIEARTWAAILEVADELGELSAERVREELWKVLSAQPDPTVTLRLYATSGALRALYPELDLCRGVSGPIAGQDLWEFLIAATKFAKSARPLIRASALFHALGWGSTDPHVDRPSLEGSAQSAAIARSILRRLKVSNADTDRITHLIAQLPATPSVDASESDIRRWVRRIGPEFLDDMFRLLIAVFRTENRDGKEIVALRRRVTAIIRSGSPLSIADLALNGSDLRELGIPQGPLYSEILGSLLERVTDDPSLNTREKLIGIVARSIAVGDDH